MREGKGVDPGERDCCEADGEPTQGEREHLGAHELNGKIRLGDGLVKPRERRQDRGTATLRDRRGKKGGAEVVTCLSGRFRPFL